MRKIIRQTLQRLRKPIGRARSLYAQSRRERAEIRAWEQAGRPAPPPPIFKIAALRSYAKRFRTPVLLETGTYNGDTVFALRDCFQRIVSIEIDDALFRAAQKRFADFPHVEIIHGDSGLVLPTLLKTITGPCLFWLDGHYSGGTTGRGTLETPVRAELEHIMAADWIKPVILIDDARCFVGKSDYPTIAELRELTARKLPGAVFECADDIIRIHR